MCGNTCSVQFEILSDKYMHKEGWERCMKETRKYKSQRDTMYGLHHCVLKPVQYLISNFSRNERLFLNPQLNPSV